MQSVRVDDGDIHFRLQGDLFDIRLSNGHCHEEFGGPSSEDVGAALAAHFMPHVKDPPAAPAVENGDTEWGRLADACAEAGQDEEALRLLENISPKRRDGFHWREELTALLRLGRFDEAIARADALGKRAEDAPLKVAPFAALALCALGRHADALKRLTRPKDGKVRDTERWDFAHAVALQSDAEALPMLDRALATNDQFLRLGFGRFVTAPALVASLQKREALTAAARRRPWR
jgi:tetratricopeptide (TPR) repeat protein